MNEGATLQAVEGFVVVIDDEPDRRAGKLRDLVQVGGVSVLGVDAAAAARVVRIVRPHAVVLEPEADGRLAPVLCDVLGREPAVRALVFGYERAQRARVESSALAHRIHGLGLPLRRAELHSLIRNRRTSSRIGPFSPAECVRAAGIGKHSVLLECVGPSGARHGSILMKEGTVVAAEADDALGFEAFARLVTRFDARVILTAPRPGEQQPDLQGPWESLMLEAMRQREGKAAGHD